MAWQEQTVRYLPNRTLIFEEQTTYNTTTLQSVAFIVKDLRANYTWQLSTDDQNACYLADNDESAAELWIS